MRRAAPRISLRSIRATIAIKQRVSSGGRVRRLRRCDVVRKPSVAFAPHMLAAASRASHAHTDIRQAVDNDRGGIDAGRHGTPGARAPRHDDAHAKLLRPKPRIAADSMLRHGERQGARARALWITWGHGQKATPAAARRRRALRKPYPGEPAAAKAGRAP